MELRLSDCEGHFKDYKIWYSPLSCLSFSSKGKKVKIKSESFLVSLGQGKALYGIPLLFNGLGR